MTTVYLALGSNQGDRLHYLRKAVRALSHHPGIRVVKSSKIYETSPVGPRQRDFLNAALKVQTEFSPAELLREIKSIERSLGRKKSKKWTARPIDIDILFYGRLRHKSGKLTIPHPRFSERKFVLRPLKDIASNFRPPGFNQTIRRIFSQLTDSDQRVKLGKGSLRLTEKAKKHE